MTVKIFVDGQEGTTGLKIFEYLAQRDDIELLQIDARRRKDLQQRRALIRASDITFLCLPDAAAREIATQTERPKQCLIDASTAFRTHNDWVYGLPELTPVQRERLRAAAQISVPGCHASAFVLSVRPLVENGVLPSEAALACHSVTGYSGGGKQMIAAYRQAESSSELSSPRLYALGLEHKHLPEMAVHGKLAAPPIFTPMVANFYQGLAVTTYLHAQHLARRVDAASLRAYLAEYYADEPFVRVMPFPALDTLGAGFFDLQACNGANRVDLFVFGHQERIVIVARLDNLGKGAAGAAIQCMNLQLGLDETAGLKC